MKKYFSTPAQMQSLIDMYFEHNANHNKTMGYLRPSIDGLVEYLELTIDEYKSYMERPAFRHIAKMGFFKIEVDLEQRTLSDDEDIEGVMEQLVQDHGWQPLDDEDRKLIKQYIN